MLFRSVIDKENNFLGLVVMDHIRDIMFRPDVYETTKVCDLMFMPETVVNPEDSMEVIAKKFQTTGNFNLAVINNGKYLGFISRARVFSAYRNLLKDFSDD